MTHKTLSFLFFFFLSLSPLPAQAEMDDFEVAEILLLQKKPKLAYPLAVSYTGELDSYLGYSSFVKKFPKAPQRLKMYMNAFKKVKQIHSEKGYDDFISLVSDTPQNFMAISEEYKLFREMDTISEYERFINKFPNTPEADYALQRIYKIAFERARELDTVEVYDQYALTFPYAGQIKAVLELADTAEKRDIATELQGSWMDIRSYFGSNQQQRETIATRVYNQGRQAEKSGEMFIAKRKYGILQTDFKDTKALTDFLNREERLEYEKAMKDYQDRIIREVKSVKSAVDVQTRAVDQAFRQMQDEIRQVKESVQSARAEVRQARAEISQVGHSVQSARGEIRRVGNSISYLSGDIARAVNMQTQAIERAREQAGREAQNIRYADEQMFRQAQEEGRRQLYKNRKCAEELRKHGKYGFLSSCP